MSQPADEFPPGFVWSDEEQRPVYVSQPCGGHGCALTEGHDGQCRDKDGWPARWNDPTYIGDGPWGA